MAAHWGTINASFTAVGTRRAVSVVIIKRNRLYQHYRYKLTWYYGNIGNVYFITVASDALVAHKTLPIYQSIIRATVLSKQSDFSTRFACRGTRQILVYLTKRDNLNLLYYFSVNISSRFLTPKAPPRLNTAPPAPAEAVQACL